MRFRGGFALHDGTGALLRKWYAMVKKFPDFKQDIYLTQGRKKAARWFGQPCNAEMGKAE